ncbi:MAG: helix-turn-helix domain-containing protein [Candidatus Methanofastidiosia archaeon]
MLEVKLQFKPKNCWAQSISETYPEIEMGVFSTHREKGLSRWRGDRALLKKALRLAKKHPTLKALEVLDERDSEVITQSVCRCKDKNKVHRLLERLGCYYLLPNPITTFGGAKHYRITLKDKKTLKVLVSRLKKLGEVKVEGVKRLLRVENLFLVSVDEMRESLTSKQKKALKLAYEKGYFKIPKKVRIKDMAKEVGVSEATFYEHLARAEEKILRLVVDHL